MASNRKDLPWLKGVVVDLLEDARQGEPDHQACAKYAELLYKLLRGEPSTAQEGLMAEVMAARKAVLDRGKPGEPAAPAKLETGP